MRKASNKKKLKISLKKLGYIVSIALYLHHKRQTH